MSERKKTVAKQSKAVSKNMSPYRRAVMIGVLAYVMALPTGYYGYEVIRKSEGVYREGASSVVRYEKVREVKDGDTVTLSSGEVVRIIGIDAPEIGQCYGEEAKRALIGLVADRDVYVLKDEQPSDTFGRSLRYLFVATEDKREGDVNVGKEMVRLGYAAQVQARPNIQYQPALRSAQAQAQQSERGMWSACDTSVWEEEKQDSTAPSESCTIKGNISSTGVKRYFTEKCRSYGQIKINTRTGEQWLCSEKEATEAGYEKSGDCF